MVGLDLIDFKTFKSSNDGYPFILCGIDCFSKKVYALPFKIKSAQETLRQFRLIKKEMGYKIPNLSVDNGTEFKGLFESYCKKNKNKFI